MFKNYFVYFVIICILSIAVAAPAAQVHLAWDASSGTVSGYRIYYGNNSGSYPKNIKVGNVTDYVVSNLQMDSAYYFVVRSFNSYGESGDSNEVSWPEITIDITPDTIKNPKTAVSFQLHINPSPQKTVTYKWDFKDGTVKKTTSPSISHTFAKAKKYPVNVSITFSNGSSINKIFNVTVEDLKPITPSKPAVALQ